MMLPIKQPDRAGVEKSTIKYFLLVAGSQQEESPSDERPFYRKPLIIKELPEEEKYPIEWAILTLNEQ